MSTVRTRPRIGSSGGSSEVMFQGKGGMYPSLYSARQKPSSSSGMRPRNPKLVAPRLSYPLKGGQQGGTTIPPIQRTGGYAPLTPTQLPSTSENREPSPPGILKKHDSDMTLQTQDLVGDSDGGRLGTSQSNRTTNSTGSEGSRNSSGIGQQKKSVRFAENIATFQTKSKSTPALLPGHYGSSNNLNGGLDAKVVGYQAFVNARQQQRPHSVAGGSGSSSSSRGSRPQRLSLSQQLALIGDSASQVTGMLRLGTADRSARQIRSISGAKERLAAAYGTQQQQQQQQPQQQTPQQQPIQQQHSKGDEVLMTMAVRSFAVGNLCSRQAYPVFFYADRAEYSFYHPYEPTEIRMIMYYRDMIQVSLQGLRFSFRVPNQLRAFKGDYDPSNPLHLITIQLTTANSGSEVRARIFPLIPGYRGKANGNQQQLMSGGGGARRRLSSF